VVKKKHWPGLEEREYRISQSHDSAAVLVVDGRIVAGAAEERFSRKKHTGDFPIGAIRYCLETAGLKPADIDEISHGFDYLPTKPPSGWTRLPPSNTRKFSRAKNCFRK
jgi:carbamoyltransferase